MIEVHAELRVVLLEIEWNNDIVSAAYDTLDAFRIERINIDVDDPHVAIFEVSTIFDDDESTAETAAYCLTEDLDDAGLFAEVEVLWGEPRLNQE